jgi:hypothetical protein
MICSRNEHPEVRYNYEFIQETNQVKVFNKNFYDVIDYHEWLEEYYIVDKWKTVE